MSNKIQIDNLYSVFEIVWMLTATVKEEFIKMEKSVDQTNIKLAFITYAIDNNFILQWQVQK